MITSVPILQGLVVNGVFMVRGTIGVTVGSYVELYGFKLTLRASPDGLCGNRLAYGLVLRGSYSCLSISWLLVLVVLLLFPGLEAIRKSSNVD